MKRLMLTATLLLAACCSPSNDTLTIRIGEERAIEAGKRIWMLSHDEGRCSAIPYAFKNGLTYFLTAKHCGCSNCGTYYLTDGESVVKALQIESHPALDVAVLVVKGKLDLVGMDPEPMEEGDWLMVAGWGLSIGRSFTEGRQSSKAGLSTASAWPGTSGGAVLDKDGILRGVLVQTAGYKNRRVFGLTHYVPATDFYSWARAVVKVGVEPSRVP